MPIYDREDIFLLFDRVIESCLSNSVLPDEIIIIVDGPLSKKFTTLVKNYEDNPIIKVIWLNQNLGLTKALNEGLKYVNTKYVFRADGDDINRPERFEIQLKMLKEGRQLVGASISERDMDGNILAIKRCPTSHEEIVEYAKRRNPFNHMTVAFELEAATKVGGYPDVYLKEDWALWALMIENGVKTGNTHKILVDATADINMYTRRGGYKPIASEFTMQKILNRHLNKSIVLSLFDFLAKATILALPARLRGYFYRNYLREEL